MSERDQTGSAAVPGSSRPRRIDWDVAGTVIAAFIGLIAILVSSYTAWNSRTQLQAQVWPHLTVGWTDTLPPELRGNAGAFDGGGMVARNDGVGPAVVRRVEVLLGGRPQADWPHLFRALGYANSKPPGATSWLSGSVFAPGQSTYLLDVAGHEPWNDFKRRVTVPLVVRACYCSILGECWIAALDDSLPANKHTWSVKSCAAAIPAASEFAE